MRPPSIKMTTPTRAIRDELSPAATVATPAAANHERRRSVIAVITPIAAITSANPAIG